MRQDGPLLILSATDLANHLTCRHLTELNRAEAEGRCGPPSWHDPALATLQERGLAHERACVASLRARGLSIVDLNDVDLDTAAARAYEAMRAGVDVIVQAGLQDGCWRGRADVLLRVAEPSRLGGWSYEVVDSKLAQETRGGTVLQLCLYSALVGRLQGASPTRMHVVKPGADFPTETFLGADYDAYYRLVRRRLEAVVASPPPSATYPTPTDHCGVCRWWKECDTRRHGDDHLSLVAGLRALHIGELERQGIRTLEQFAEEPNPTREKPERGSEEAFARAQGQARIQLEGRRVGALRYELLPHTPGIGLARLPEPDEGDLFFDIESDPFVADGGLEYLLGVVSVGADGGFEYRAFWGWDRIQERLAFEQFVDFVMEQWRLHTGMHVYHFSPYEPAAVKRLMGRHGTREADVDRLLRGQRFVDLLAVTRQGVRASVESYSLKEMEKFCGFARTVELPAAAAALRRVSFALEFDAPGRITEPDRVAVQAYNKDDCFATAALRDWLEARRAELVGQGAAVERPPLASGDASETIEARAADVQTVFDRLVAGLGTDRSGWSNEDRARWLLANQLDYFRREDRCAWWEFFRIRDLDHEELLDERKALSGLQFVGGTGGTPKCPIHRYRFPDQEAAIDAGDDLDEAGKGDEGAKIGKVEQIDQMRRTVDIKKRADSAHLHPLAVLTNERVKPNPVDASHLAIASSVAADGVDGVGPHRAARDLLLRKHPRLAGGGDGPLVRDGEEVVSAAVRLAHSLDNGVLPIQGPPGTGKTYTGARMIVALAREDKRVGVTAVSHKVIRNLLDEVLVAAAEAGGGIELVHKVSKRTGETPDGLEETTDNAVAREGVLSGKVVGGSAWLWARENMVESLDYLFVDEAGQMSLAHALAVGRSAKNIVLLGDPQQLEQPQRGAHPEGAEVAALVHVLDGHQTIADDAGVFLDVTWRLHPSICQFTSEMYYEGRLRSRAGLERQAVGRDTPFSGSGLFYVPVEHSGNQNRSIEEAAAITRIVDDLLRRGVTWIDDEGTARQVEPQHILIVAPYNAQVAALTEGMPEGVRVGTVDKFQGQQAPVVIYSMASSSAEDAPRGMSFLYDPHRLNVATSRARCICILVGSPLLFEPDCRTPEQMRLANGLCRYRELAMEVAML